MRSPTKYDQWFVCKYATVAHPIGGQRHQSYSDLQSLIMSLLNNFEISPSHSFNLNTWKLRGQGKQKLHLSMIKIDQSLRNFITKILTKFDINPLSNATETRTNEHMNASTHGQAKEEASLV